MTEKRKEFPFQLSKKIRGKDHENIFKTKGIKKFVALYCYEEYFEHNIALKTTYYLRYTPDTSMLSSAIH